MSEVTVGGFVGDPVEAFNPPAVAGGCCGGAGEAGSCCGTTEAMSAGGCCEPGDTVAPGSGSGCCG